MRAGSNVEAERPQLAIFAMKRRPNVLFCGLLAIGSLVASTAAAELPPTDPSARQPPSPPPGATGYPPPSPSDPPQLPQGTSPAPYPPAATGYPPAPGYALPAGYAPVEPPLPPPPPQREELSWSLRFNVFDLVFGKLSGEIEHAFGNQLSIVVGPEYIFADPRQDSSLGITASGGGLYGEIGYWLEGRPLRGYFLKAHVGYRSVVFHSELQRLHVPETLIGAMFGSQTIYAGWFSLSGGIGVAYDLNAEDRQIDFQDPNLGGAKNTATLQATGPLHNGFDLITQLAIGGSF
jgi:hypothetical protein